MVVVSREFKQYYVELRAFCAVSVVVGLINRVVGETCGQIGLEIFETRKHCSEFRLVFSDGMEVKVGQGFDKTWIHVSLPKDHPADPKSIVENIIKIIEKEERKEKEEGSNG